MQPASADLRYRRILLKLSGEALQGDSLCGIDSGKLTRVSGEIASIASLGAQVAVVIGGGNLIRGAELALSGINRVVSDQMGMLATVINGLALRDALLNKGLDTSLMSAIPISSVVETYDHMLAKEKLSQGKVVIFAGGTGNPLVTTDSAAALRGIEVAADVLIKATKVDAVFSDDPIKNPQAKRYDHLSYARVIQDQLGVMDLNSILLCRDHGLAIRVFNMNKQGALQRIVSGEELGTLIDSGE